MTRVESFEFIGANGSVLDLLNNELFYVSDIEGMTSASAGVSSSTSPNMDGVSVNAVQLDPRSIVLTLTFKQGVDIEAAKRTILRTVKPKLAGALRMKHTERDVQIDGLVTGVEMPRFTSAVAMQITLYCSEPCWHDAEFVAVEISRILDAHYFPIDEGGLAFPEDGVIIGEYDVNMTQTYTNEGDFECGMTITIIALGDVVNPKIYKSDGTFLGVNDTLVKGDQIVINTSRGEKSITKNGVNIFSKVAVGSTFFNLDVGDNQITIDSDGDTEINMYFVLSFKRRFV